MVVRGFVERFGSQRTGAVLGLFADTGRVEFRGLGIAFQGRSRIRELLGYGKVVGSSMTMLDAGEEDGFVVGRLREENEWTRMLGIEGLFYRARFLVLGGRVVRAELEPEPNTKARLKEPLAGFVFWLKENEPETLAQLLPGGRLAFDARNGRRLLDALHRWEASR